jgi:uncharacterized protein (TIGR02001 family)
VIRSPIFPTALGWLLGTLLAALCGADPAAGADFSFEGSLALTSEYIYRGVAERDDHAAAQLDGHATTDGGTFLGAWISTRDRNIYPGTGSETEVYLGHRFDLSSAWNASLTASSHYYLGGTSEPSADYQQIAAALGYLDRWSVSVTAVPNAVRYWYYVRLSRSPAWIAETSAQWLLHEGLFATGGVGFYYSSGTGPRIDSASDYAYGNAGLAYERGRLRLDVGYFVTQAGAAVLFPYPIATHRIAGTLTWHF